MHLKSKTIGLYVRLRPPLRVVFQRRVDYFWDKYDVFKPMEKIEAIVMIIQELAKENTEFTQKLVAIDEKYYSASYHRKRHYVHSNREKLYGDKRLDLAEKYSRQVSGIWLATNLGQPEKLQVIMEACEAAEVEYGSLTSLKW